MTKIFYTENARTDLRGIRKFVKEKSGDAKTANHFILSIQQKCQTYSEHPLIGRISETYGGGVRRFPFGNYVIFYKPIEDGIAILHVWHGSQNLPDLIRSARQE